MDRKIYLATVFALIFLPAILSMDIYVRPPRMVLRLNVTPGRESSATGSLEIKNQNDYDVNVTFKPEGDLVGRIEIPPQAITLMPGETRNVDFRVKVKEPGTYQGIVIVTYSAEGQISAGIQAEIYIIATESREKRLDLKYVIVGFIFLIVLILVFLLKKGVKKRGV